MNNYAFEIVLTGVNEVSEELTDRIFSAGGDDSTPTSRNGVVTICFDREATSLEDAVRSALKTIHDAGYVARTVQAAPESFAL